MPRIPFPDPNSMTPEQRRVYDTVVSGPRGKMQGPLLAALHRPELADKWQQLGELLRYRTSLPTRLTELAILVTARTWRCSLEWYIHEPVAQEAGLPQSVIDAVRDGHLPKFCDDELGADDAVVYKFVAQLQEHRFVSSAAYDNVLEKWGTVGVVELAAVVGYYTMVAMTLNAHEFELPPNASAPFANGRSNSIGKGSAAIPEQIFK